jgi:hypothetical protein
MEWVGSSCNLCFFRAGVRLGGLGRKMRKVSAKCAKDSFDSRANVMAKVIDRKISSTEH